MSLNNQLLENPIVVKQQSGTPATPASGNQTIYVDTNNQMKMKLPNGSTIGVGGLTVTPIAAADFNGSTLANGNHYIVNMSAASGDISATLPNGATGSNIQVTTVNNESNHWQVTVNAATSGGQEYIVWEGTDYTGIKTVIYNTWFLLMWNGTKWIVDNAQQSISGALYGNLNISGTLGVGDGSASSPSATFVNDTNTGFYKYADNKIGISCNGTFVGAITSTGIGIGNDPSVPLHIEANGNSQINVAKILNINSGSSTVCQMILGTGGSGDGVEFLHVISGGSAYGGSRTFNIRNGYGGGVYLGAGSTSWASLSDMRYKTKIADFTNALNKISNLSVFTYRLNEEEECARVHLGMSAQEVVTKIPEIVEGTPDTKMGINYDKLGPILVKAVQEQQEIIESLKIRIAALENR